LIARSTNITFLDNPKYLDGLATTRAGVCLTAPRLPRRRE
jgi:UDP-3-O-[3-hydroxymyristoyl] glucosamine N-acyltransferase